MFHFGLSGCEPYSEGLLQRPSMLLGQLLTVKRKLQVKRQYAAILWLNVLNMRLKATSTSLGGGLQL